MSILEGMGGLLRLVQLSGGQVEARIRLQKEAFLIAIAGDAAFNSREFVYHHYGPYSRSLSDVLQTAVALSFLEEQVEGWDDQSVKRYSYRLTPLGEKFLSQCPEPSQVFRHVVGVCKDKPWRALELAATVRFLETKEGKSRGDAINEALALKPATADFLPQANGILASL
jgi:Uncharacterized conserved protein